MAAEDRLSTRVAELEGMQKPLNEETSIAQALHILEVLLSSQEHTPTRADLYNIREVLRGGSGYGDPNAPDGTEEE